MTSKPYADGYFTGDGMTTPAPAEKKRRLARKEDAVIAREYEQHTHAVDRYLSDLAYAKKPLDKIDTVLRMVPDLGKESLAYEIVQKYNPLEENILRPIVRSFVCFRHPGGVLKGRVANISTVPFVHAMVCLGVHTIDNDDDDDDRRFTSRRTDVLMNIFTRVRATLELRLELAYCIATNNCTSDFVKELIKQGIFASIIEKYPLSPDWYEEH